MNETIPENGTREHSMRERIGETASSLGDRVGAAIGGAGDRVGAAIGGAGERVGAAIGGAGERISTASTGAQRQASRLFETLTATMARHPLATIAVGLGVGFVIARAIARR